MSSSNKFLTTGVVESKLTIDPLITDLVILIVGCVFTVLVCLFGIAANIVNLPLFRKLGYQDGVNVTLTALAISDLGGLIFELVYSLMMNPYILEIDLVVSKVVIGFITGYMFEYFTRVSGVITAYAALERCLCVIWPLKVKTIITNKVSVAVNLSIFTLYSMYLFPQFYSTHFDWTYVPERNKTVYVIYFNSRRAEVFPVIYYVTDILLPCSTYIVLITCCTTLFVKLQSKAKWRKQVSSSGVSHITSKERKSARMFMTVSFMAVVLLLPQSVFFSAMIFNRALAMDGAYSDLSLMISTITILFKISNSSFTIFIYYNMSSKYRLEFQKMFLKFKTSIIKT
ncbi:FMRFamide receptor [Biomphalaria glabrata]|nr:FMRFamide receptor [Biomphalaria glabrata]KAI8781877.1 FMRFamide receptor [Biomphalaria glabrata]